MALAVRYFTEFGKPAFQLKTASSSIELIDHKSASITHRAQPYKLQTANYRPPLPHQKCLRGLKGCVLVLHENATQISKQVIK